ncbi:Rab11 family-interacting protein 1 [Channa argus]|uniref:Rab11 family-interacting protein 1 n=1 Tax=Channa argus TaxID=215402 RepID=A0A6G1Q0P4_CHAAH|nr:Rab11 family-interacting protein 1 [Channa argus]
MSLADQSQQWFPTSVQVTVHQARSLRIKGKNGTNDAYAIIQVAKDKFSTSVAEKCVAPSWKEEASFDLPLFHPGNAERCTLYIIVMHRAQVGLDKFLGQAVINLLDLHDNNSRKKTDWFKLVDKTGKEDKARGEVLLDIQFMRNNMSASMFDLSMQDKPRSKISKLKDKVRGKKKDGFSDSASAIVPSVNQVLTDSEGEADAQSLNPSPEGKKKYKLKTLFAPKSNLQRNISQSMSTLGTFPEKNSSLSGSRSSGLNVDSPDVKKKFKFLGHKRTGSSDSKASQGPFSFLGRSKQSNNDLNNLCINGSHVYAEEAEPKSGSTLSLNSSGQGSVDDVNKHTTDVSADSSISIPVQFYKHEPADRAQLEQQHHQEEEVEKRRQAEEKRLAEAKKLEEEQKRRAEAKRLLEEEEKCRAEAKRLLEEEEKRRAEAKRLLEEEKRRAEAKRLMEEEEHRYQEEHERKRHLLEDEARRKKKKGEEEDKRKQEEEHRVLEAAETQRLEEERQRAEEQKRQDEASMSDRLTSLFGMIRKKEEKKEEVHQHLKKESPTPAPRSNSTDPHEPIFHQSTNFEDKLSSDLPVSSNESPADSQKSNHNTQIPSATVFLHRSAKVSAVKPRFTQCLDSESAEYQTPSQLCTPQNNSTHFSVPTDSPDTFSNLHSTLAPSHISQSLLGSPRGSLEDLSIAVSSPTMADKKKKAPLPPTYTVHETHTGGNNVTMTDTKNSATVVANGLQQGQKVALPLPDYDSMIRQKRHGVKGQTRWDHIVAEVNQRHRDVPAQFLEMSVDGPGEQELNPTCCVTQESPVMGHYQTHHQETKSGVAPAPPKTVALPQSVAESSQRVSHDIAHQSLLRSNPSAVPSPGSSDTSSKENLHDFTRMPRSGARKVMLPLPASINALRTTGQLETTPPDNQRKAKVTMNKKAPTAKTRQSIGAKAPTQQEESNVTQNSKTNPNIQKLSGSKVSSSDKKIDRVESLGDFNAFPSSELFPKDPWAEPKQNQVVDELFTSKRNEQKPKHLEMTEDFGNDKLTDPFASLSGSYPTKPTEYRKNDDDDSKEGSPVFQRRNSQRKYNILPSTTHSNKKGLKSEQQPKNDKGGTKAITDQNIHAAEVMDESVTLQTQHEKNAQGNFYGGDDLFGAEPFTVPSGLTSSEPLQVVMEEPASQGGGLSGGKTLLRAWVSPSEIPLVSGQSSNGGGLGFAPRRPHPVKPLSSVESQPPTSAQAVKEIKTWDVTPRKIKVADSVESGPYTQLTQEELITLVVKQQTDLSKKDAKIIELEEYIDHLLVRVIEEKPSILQALNSAKPV